MDKFKTSQELIACLNDKGVTALEIAEKVGYHFSAIYKVARGSQKDLPYAVGKRIEKLCAAKRKK